MARTKKVVRTTNLNKVKNQKTFIETYLRGTGRTLSPAQAKAIAMSVAKKAKKKAKK